MNLSIYRKIGVLFGVLFFSILGFLSIALAAIGLVLLASIHYFIFHALDFPLGTLALIGRLMCVMVLFAGTFALFTIAFLAIKGLLSSVNKPIQLLYKTKAKLLIICGTCWLVPMILALILSLATQSIAKSEIKNFLRDVSDYARVSIEGKSVSEPERFISELRKITRIPAHHSHYTRKIAVEIISANRKVTLLLGRDSDNAQEYWVLYPYYPVTSLTPPIHIGGIITELFDDY